MARQKAQVRRSQLITTYGVGAMIAVENESFMIAGIDRWDATNAPEIHEPRLERELGVQMFRLPAANDHDDVPMVRFPRYQSCPSCRRLDKFNHIASYKTNVCADCGVALVPSRFVTVCTNGHIDDFPYFQWLHTGEATENREHQMRIDSTGETSTLNSIVLNCSCGVTPRSLDGAFSKHALQGIRRCYGGRPWLGEEDATQCREVLRTVLRGASNAWFPVVHSSISIPPWSEAAFARLSRYWGTLQFIDDDVSLRKVIEGRKIADGVEVTVDDLIQAVRQRKAQTGAVTDDGQTVLRDQEFEALSHERLETSREQEFVCEPPASLGRLTTSWLSQVMLVRRLREVRALKEFTRLHPPSAADPRERRAPLSLERENWLPAIEVNGEGVFLRLHDDKVGEWERLPAVEARARLIDKSYRATFENRDAPPDRTITPRFLLAHTLAHALINQWSLDCGYPAASLRERLYVSDSFVAFLIYTATSDSAGSLGGVVSLAETEQLDTTLGAAIRNAAWCSADPLCIEAESTGVDALNLAACHACLLLPEVSCEESNLLLDRAMLVGTPLNPSIGFFASMLS